MPRIVTKTNVGYVGDLRSAIAVHPAIHSSPVRVYDARNGTEYRIVEVYVEDGITCLDIEPTGEITTAS